MNILFLSSDNTCIFAILSPIIIIISILTLHNLRSHIHQAMSFLTIVSFLIMQVQFRTLTKEAFSLELDPIDTLAQHRDSLAERVGRPAATLRFILRGKVLSDRVTINSLNLTPTDFIAIHTPRIAPPPDALRPTSTPPGPTTEPLPAIPPPADETAPTWAQAISQLRQLGFIQEDIEICLRAARGNTDTAMDYLLNGLPSPDELQRQDDQKFHSDRHRYREAVIADPRMLEHLINQLESARSPIAAQARAHPELLVQQLGLRLERYLDVCDAIREGRSPPVILPGPADEAAPEVEDQESRQYDDAHKRYRDAVVANPAVLAYLIAQLVAWRSDIAPQIYLHPELLVQQLGLRLEPYLDICDAIRQGQPVPGYGIVPEPEGLQAARTVLVEFTQEETEAIQRLRAVGNLSLAQAIQAFLAAGRNETEAVKRFGVN
jgi:hypothetical protein